MDGGNGVEKYATERFWGWSCWKDAVEMERRRDVAETNG